MISRIEFYITCALIISAIVLGFYLTTDNGPEINRGKTEVLDSILQEQRDSALAHALSMDLQADSLQAIINRRNLDIQLITKKYESQKNSVLVLSADSTLSFFTSSVAH